MEKQRKSKPPIVATVRCEILDANMLPPTTASEVQMVCPKVAPTATPSAFLCVASCRTSKLEITRKSKISDRGVANTKNNMLSIHTLKI